MLQNETNYYFKAFIKKGLKYYTTKYEIKYDHTTYMMEKKPQTNLDNQTFLIFRYKRHIVAENITSIWSVTSGDPSQWMTK